MHRISDNRLTKTADAYVRTVRAMCGQKAMQAITFVTTMWDDGREDDLKISRERTLRMQWEHETQHELDTAINRNGVKFFRFRNTYESAWEIIDAVLAQKPTRQMQIQEELQRGVKLEDTKAAVTQSTLTKPGFAGRFLAFVRRIFQK